jgi:hypothetical protein
MFDGHHLWHQYHLVIILVTHHIRARLASFAQTSLPTDSHHAAYGSYGAVEKRTVAAALLSAFPPSLPSSSSSSSKKPRRPHRTNMKATIPSSSGTTLSKSSTTSDDTLAPPTGSNIWLVSGDSLCQQMVL